MLTILTTQNWDDDLIIWLVSLPFDKKLILSDWEAGPNSVQPIEKEFAPVFHISGYAFSWFECFNSI